MAANEHYSTAVVAYARSLLEVAEQRQQTDAILQELKAIQQIVRQLPRFAQFLEDPAFSQSDRAGVLERSLGPAVSELMRNFLGVLNRRGALKRLAIIADAYEDLLLERRGIVDVDVTVARKLTDPELDRIGQRLSTAIRRQAIVHQRVDESIVGGLVLRIDDRLIDASVRYQLRAAREQLLSAQQR